MGNTGKIHAFRKYFSHNDDQNNGKKGGNNGNGGKTKSDCGNEVYPIGVCSKCGKYKERQRHHIIPQWICRALAKLGIHLEECEAERTIDFCPKCHKTGIEKLNQLFSAVVMIRYKKQYAEIVQLYLDGKDSFTFEELSILADGGSLKDNIVFEQVVSQEVKIETEN